MYQRNSYDCAVRREVASLVDTRGGQVESLAENDGGIGQIWVNCRGAMQVLQSFSGIQKMGC